MKQTDLAYIAGIIDGEGCIIAALEPKRRRTSQLRLGIRSTDYPILQWMLDTVGAGTLRKQPFCSSRLGRKTQWYYHLGQGEAAQLLRKLLPYLLRKREQANLFVTLVEARSEEPLLPVMEQQMILDIQADKRREWR